MRGRAALNQASVGAANRNEETGTEEEVDVVEGKLSVIVNVFCNGEDVVVVFFRLGALRAMAAVFDLQFVEGKAKREFIKFRRGGIADVEPGQMRKHGVHAGQFYATGFDRDQ